MTGAIERPKIGFMDPVTKDYIDSHDEVVETRNEARYAETLARIDAQMLANAAQVEAEKARHEASERRFVFIEAHMDRIEKGMASLRTTVIVTGISVVIGIAGLNTAILQNMQTSFDSGRMVSAAQAEVQRQVRETDAKLRQIDVNLVKTDERFAAIDDKLAKVAEKLTKIDEKLANVDETLAKTDGKLARTEGKLRETDALLKSLQHQVHSPRR